MSRQVLISCEHGGNRIPARYLSLFAGHRKMLSTHRGYDRGALSLARRFAKELTAPLCAATISRLLVDLNRSLHNPRVFSDVTRSLSPVERERVIEGYYRPHREQVERRVQHMLATGAMVVHLAIHTFTPRLRDKVRKADVGFLYDPKRAAELDFCLEWQRNIESAAPELRVRRNYPYRGTADGLTTCLRKQFPSSLYAGIELELNQMHVGSTGTVSARVTDALICSLPL